jgi:hypothetical protein
MTTWTFNRPVRSICHLIPTQLVFMVMGVGCFVHCGPQLKSVRSKQLRSGKHLSSVKQRGTRRFAYCAPVLY